MELYQVIILLMLGYFVFQLSLSENWNDWSDKRTLSYGHPYYYMFREGIDKPCLETKGCKNCHYDHYNYAPCDKHSGNVMYINSRSCN